ncbi:MAG: hypothetical protein K2X77_14530 [Candidatus Obscuribacterales bacterium]|jgi:hypothetical protein|nr:hypothetical protein [Candidatus Obscuribacterales bacterium]
MRFLLSLLLTTTAVIFILPYLPGVAFGGSLFSGTLIALLLVGSIWFFKQVARAFALSLGLTAPVPGLLVQVPLAVFGMWLLPAAELVMVASLTEQLVLQSWTSAITAGLVLLLINASTHRWSDTLRKPCCPDKNKKNK